MNSKCDVGEAQVPDMTRILDGLFIGNLASATSLPQHPELGITHILSVCPQNRGEPLVASTAASPPDARYSATNPRHCSIIIDDSESQDIILQLPAAVAFIRDALQEEPEPSSRPNEPPAVGASRGAVKAQGADAAAAACLADRRRSSSHHKVLVHCVMGISRSATVVCAYLMATRRLSPAQALAFVRRRRPQVHPNYGFYRQLAVYAESDYFDSYPAPVRTHPAYNAWVRRKKREISRFLTRVGNVVEIDLGYGNVLSMTDDFPTDVTEAGCLLGEIEATHFLTISPSTLPPLPPPPPKMSASRRKSREGNDAIPGFLAPASECGPWSPGSSSISSPTSSRSSSFSNGVTPPNVFSGPSTAATSMHSLLQSSQEKLLADLDAFDAEEVDEPDFLTLTGVKHYHIGLPSSGHSLPDQAAMLLRLNEACSVIDSAYYQGDSDHEETFAVTSDEADREQKPKKCNVLVHCATESRAALVMCAYLMYGKSLSPKNAYCKLETALPLFNATKSFLNQLELFYAFDCCPSRDDPLITSWIGSGCKTNILDSKRALLATQSSKKPARHTATSQQRSPASASAPSQRTQQRAFHHDSSLDDDDSDSDDGEVLRRKIGTPARCGSFAAHTATRPLFGQQHYVPSQLSSSAPSRMPSRRPSTSASAAPLRQCLGCNGGLSTPLSAVTPSPTSTTAARRGTNSEVDVDALLKRVTGVGRPDFSLDVEAFRGTLRDLGLRANNMHITDRS